MGGPLVSLACLRPATCEGANACWPAAADPEDPLRITDNTRSLGLTVSSLPLFPHACMRLKHPHASTCRICTGERTPTLLGSASLWFVHWLNGWLEEPYEPR